MQTLNLTKKYEKYTEYKDSGIDWLGKIPKEWDSRKIKTFSKTLAGGTPATDNVLYWENGTIPWLPSGMVHDNIIFKNTKEKYITELGLKESATKVIPKDSVLIALTGATCANIAYLTFSATANQSVVAIVNNKKNSLSKYIYYSLLSNREQILTKRTGGAQSGINEQDVKNLFITFPEIEEQTKIASYLDEKTQLIDKIIEKKEKLIELLKEKRIAVINNAVTKGLDKNTSLVESGVEWIGKIPKGWRIEKMKFLATTPLQYGANEAAIDDNILDPRFIRITDVDNNGNLKKDTFKSISKELARPYILKEGDILLARTGATVGKTFKYKKEWGLCCFAGYLIKISVNNKKISSDYLKYITESDYYWRWINSIFIKSTIQNVSAEKYKEFLVLFPNEKDEQLKIVNYLNEKIIDFNKASSFIENSIELLKEFKTSLISNVVTGKIKV